jgi:hypothetical protein
MLASQVDPFESISRLFRETFLDKEKLMKTSTLADYLQAGLVLAGLMLLTGCWVESINGLYEDGNSSRDADLVVDQRLVGSWSMSEPGVEDPGNCETTALTITSTDQIYPLKWPLPKGCIDKVQNYEARLVKLDTYYFLDARATRDAICDTCIATHQIFRVDLDSDELSLTPIDSDWLNQSLADKSVTLATMPDESDTVTASTADLKDFCRRFAADQAAFKPESALTFRRVSADHAASH